MTQTNELGVSLALLLVSCRRRSNVTERGRPRVIENEMKTLNEEHRRLEDVILTLNDLIKGTSSFLLDELRPWGQEVTGSLDH